MIIIYENYPAPSNWYISMTSTNFQWLFQAKCHFSRPTSNSMTFQGKIEIPWLFKACMNHVYTTLSFLHHFVAIGEFKLELQSRNAKFGSNSTIFLAVWPWNLTDDHLSMVITPENFLMIRWWEHGEKGVTDGQTDRQTDRRTDGLNQSYSCLVAAKKGPPGYNVDSNGLFH